MRNSQSKFLVPFWSECVFLQPGPVRSVAAAHWYYHVWIGCPLKGYKNDYQNWIQIKSFEIREIFFIIIIEICSGKYNRRQLRKHVFSNTCLMLWKKIFVVKKREQLRQWEELSTVLFTFDGLWSEITGFFDAQLKVDFRWLAEKGKRNYTRGIHGGSNHNTL